MAPRKGSKAHNYKDRTGIRYGKLVALKDDGEGYWLCKCDCGNESRVLSTNLAAMAKGNKGCRSCGNRKDITGERIGFLTALETEAEVVTSRHPLWTFQCDCGNTIQGTVREFHAQWLRSCGCIDNAHSSWVCMVSRCYKKTDVRYNSYGGRGIKVCIRWHKFENFLADMGERPKRYNLGRKKAEEHYKPSNCIWEHISKNCRDTANSGEPTIPGRQKGAIKRK